MEYKYYAFVSYNHRDVNVAQWLHRNLESFRLPSEIHNEIEAEQKYMRPVFRDKDELNAGILGNELREKLEASKFLIVICSRNSAKSEWVSNEVKAFIEMGRLDRIIPLMIEEGPEVFPKSLREYTAVHPEMELLGVSIPEVGKEKALVRIISKMLGVSFDSLWDRHKRQRRRNRILSAVGASLVVAGLACVWYFNQPKDVLITVNEGGYVNAGLPAINDIVVSLDLGSEIKTDTVQVIGGQAVFANIPAKLIGKNAALSIAADHCMTLDTTVVLSTAQVLNVSRVPAVYGHVSARLFNFNKGSFVAGARVQLAGMEVMTDSDGAFTLDVPIERQATQYEISSPDATILDNVIYMPCQKQAILETK